MAEAKPPWPPDVWNHALRATGSTSWALCRTKAECDGICASRRGWRAWAFDLGAKAGATNHPKRYIAAPVRVFCDAYARMEPEHRHAYEIIQGPCWLFFDLECYGEHRDGAAAQARLIEEAARATVAELAAAQQLTVRIETLALDSLYAEKFSRHMVLRVTEASSGRAVLLRGPGEAGAVAARAAERAGGSAQVRKLIDLAVYAPGRCFRLLGSAKMAGAHRAPLLLNAHDEPRRPPTFAADVEHTLVVPSSREGAVLLEAPQQRAVPPQPRPASVAASTAGPAASTARPLSQAAWECRWRHVTAMPLLDCPGFAHPRVRTRSGAGLPPAPMDAVGRWGAALLERCGATLASWRYQAAEWPTERLLHLVGSGGCCAHVGRRHRLENIMVSIDLLNGLAWQRCFDKQCRVEVRRGRLCGHRKARAFLGSVPAGLLP